MSLRLSHAGADITVDAPEADCRWLEQFMTPAFAVGGSSAVGTSHVRYELGPAPAVSSPSATRRVVFVLDRGPILLAESLENGVMHFDDEQMGVSYSVARHPASATVHASTRSGLSRVALMRVVREYAHNAILDSGGLVLHAAAAMGPHGAIVIAGPKGSGKTTLLSRLLGLEGFGYLANDRVAIARGSTTALAVPTIVGIRAGTRGLLPSVTRALERLPDFSGDDAASVNGRSGGGTWYFSPRQFAGALGRPILSGAAISAVVVLSGIGQAASLPMSHDASVQALRSALMGHHAGHLVSEVFRVAPRVDVLESVEEACSSLAARIPVFSVTVPDEPNAAALESMVRSWR